MSELHRVGSVETSEDEAFEHAEWRVQRVAWALMALFVAAGAAGLFGSGPISHAATGDDQFRVEYERFARYEASTRLDIDVVPSGAQVEVWIERRFLDQVEVQAIVPEPNDVELQPDRIVYRWDAGQKTLRARVSFQVRHTSIGRVSGRAGAGAGPEVSFNQLVYP